MTDKGVSDIKKPIIYILSDSLGETAEYVSRAAACQFNYSGVEYKRIPYVNSTEYLYEVLDKIDPDNSLLVYTLVIDEVREALINYAQQRHLMTVDVLQPMLEALEKITGAMPKGEPGLVRELDDNYFKKIEAVEFAVKYDDGKDPRGVLYADLVLIGVSRTSKTPLCMYLAHRGIKAANIPLVPEVKVSEEVFRIPRHKIIGLTIKPQVLHEIRKERLKALGLGGEADYASLERIMAELDYAEGVMKKIGCPVIDVSRKAVEETASKVLQIYYRGDNISE